jgi:hypothetical protein
MMYSAMVHPPLRFTIFHEFNNGGENNFVSNIKGNIVNLLATSNTVFTPKKTSTLDENCPRFIFKSNFSSAWKIKFEELKS